MTGNAAQFIPKEKEQEFRLESETFACLRQNKPGIYSLETFDHNIFCLLNCGELLRNTWLVQAIIIIHIMLPLALFVLRSTYNVNDNTPILLGIVLLFTVVHRIRL